MVRVSLEPPSGTFPDVRARHSLVARRLKLSIVTLDADTALDLTVSGVTC